MKQPLKLYAPIDYWMASDKEKKEICNGCGAKKGLDVPDSFYGLDISMACNIHDWMYEYGTTEADRLFSDAIFRLNLTMLIDNTNFNILSKILKPLRHSLASTYYNAVVLWGKDAYWINKDKNDLLIITYKGRFEEIA